MNQADVEQWIAQNGGQGRVQYSRSTSQIDNPAADPMTAKTAGVKFDPAAPAKLTINEEKWTAVDDKGQPTGAALHVRRRPDGDFDIVDQANQNPTKPGNDPNSPASRAAAATATVDETKAEEATREAAERKKNRELPANQDPRDETDAQRAARADATIRQQGVDALAADARERQRKIDAQNAATAAAAARRADSAEARAVAEANKVGSKVDDLTINGQHYTRITKTSADGKTTSVENYGPSGTLIPTLPTETKPGSVVTLNGEFYWATPAADPSQPPKLTRIDPTSPPADDGPQFAPGMSGSDYLTARRGWLMQQRRAGVSQKEINDIWDRDVQTATAKQNEANTQATQQNQRLSAATTGLGQAMTSVENINKYLPVGSDLGGKALEAFLGIQRGQAQRMGGYGPMGGPPLAVPPAPNVPDPSSQVAAIPPGPSRSAAMPTLASPEGQGLMATNEANRQLWMAQHGTQPASDVPVTAPPVTPPAVPGTPSPLGDTGAPPVSMAGAPAAPVSAIPESPYAFQARIMSSPPWKLSESDLQQAQAMGLENSFWATPGVRAVA